MYNYIWDEDDFENCIFDENEINTLVKIKNKVTGRYVLMNRFEKQNFRDQQNLLKVLDDHAFDQQTSKKFWHELLVLEKLSRNMFVVILDHMSSFELGPNLKSNSSGTRNKVGNGAQKLVPLGVVVVYKDHDTNEIKRLNRLVTPDSVALTAWGVIKCLENLFDDEEDEILQNMISNRSHAIVINS